MSVKQKNNPLISNVTIGADIELFLIDKVTKEVVSAEGIIKGSKEAPFRFKENNPFFATSLDNILCEFCIPPAKNAKEFNSYILEAQDYIRTTIPPELDIFAFPSAHINEKWLKTQNAMTLGCEPDYNAWKFGAVNEKPDATSNIRSAGGHIHCGYDKSNSKTNLSLIKAMDIFVGLPSVIQEPDNDRKSLYGCAGAFRHKSYGIEYRSVSNYYLTSPELTEWVFGNTMQAIDFVNMQSAINEDESYGIQLAINTNNKSLAQTLCTYFGVKLAA
jgi:hypothetical protein